MSLTRKYRYLTYNDRCKLEALYKQGLTQAAIARALGVHRSTVCREIPLGLCDQREGRTWKTYKVYSADIAQHKHDWMQTARGQDLKIAKRMDYLTAIEDRVLDNHSFEDAILYLSEVQDFGVKISKQTAYRYLKLGLFPRLTYDHLPRPRKKRRTGRVRRANTQYPDHTSIEYRPWSIDSRQEMGHWEMDSVIGKAKGNKQSALVLTERKTRQEVILRPNGKTAQDTVAALRELRTAIGPDFVRIFQTITCDNGSEFADRQGIEATGVICYWCHPQSPGERGSNENANGLIRRKWPKGKSLRKVTQKDARAVMLWLNDYRRPLLGGKCSRDVFFAELDKLPLQDPARVKAFFT